MKNIETILAGLGIEIPEDKKEAFNKEFHENYKTSAEFAKVIAKSDAYKEQAESASETLKKFEGLEPEKVKQEIDSWKKKAEDAEKDFNAKIAAKDYDEALTKAMESYKFSSTAAKKNILSQIRDQKLPVKDGKILGLNDFIESIKSEDASAFVTEGEEHKARFTAKASNKGAALTKEQILEIKDATERQKAIAENLDLFR